MSLQHRDHMCLQLAVHEGGTRLKLTFHGALLCLEERRAILLE